MPDQLALEIGPGCKERGCTAPVVGSSITGKGHVCRAHNEREWGMSLSRNKYSEFATLGRRLIEDSTR